MHTQSYYGKLVPATWPIRVPRLMAALRHSKNRRLDPEVLSDHMRRDLGLLGGRDLPPRDILRD